MARSFAICTAVAAHDVWAHDLVAFLALRGVVNVTGVGARGAEVAALPSGVIARVAEILGPDGSIHIASRRPLRPGDIVSVKVERADAYDLHGTMLAYHHASRLLEDPDADVRATRAFEALLLAARPAS